MSKLFMSILLVAGCLNAAHAAEPAASIVEGVGLETCGVFGNQYAQAPQVTETVVMAWVEGNVSAANGIVTFTGRPDLQIDITKPGDGIDMQTAFIENYCNAHPLDTVVDAVAAMLTAAQANEGIIPTP